MEFAVDIDRKAKEYRDEDARDDASDKEFADRLLG